MKLKKFKKKILFFVIIIILGIIILYFNISKKKFTNKDFKIETYQSLIDKDLDGIDDQTDILINVKNYIKKKPIYKSKYYETGYSNDQYGVCTDVVANGLLNAGYDLMELVNQDIKENREEYDVLVIDKLIDFRRVRNLKVYFQRNSISLTNDVNKIEEWQGGDIVIFKNHIGIISNFRNKKGIPFVIHHRSLYQLNYEEDILESPFYTVEGHFRIS